MQLRLATCDCWRRKCVHVEGSVADDERGSGRKWQEAVFFLASLALALALLLSWRWPWPWLCLSPAAGFVNFVNLGHFRPFARGRREAHADAKSNDEVQCSRAPYVPLFGVLWTLET